MIKSNIIKAYNFAEKAHEGVPRKYSGLPYFSHPKGVARIIEELTDNEELIIVALLHDTVEDTTVTLEDIEKEFGKSTASLVGELTSDKKQQNKLGKDLYLLDKMRNMSNEALLIKLADRLHNILYLQGDIVPIEFIKKYYKETRFLLNNLSRSSQYYLPETHIILIEKIKTVLDFLNIRHKIEEEKK